MATLFTKIIQGEIPCHKLYEDEKYFSFLDIRPLKEGHALVIPKAEVDYIFDLDEEAMSGLWKVATRVAKAIQRSVRCKRIGVAVIGLEVPHTHIHLVPLEAISDLDFSKARAGDSGALQALAEKICANMQ
jgi:histidine triad (HIT) family protein